MQATLMNNNTADTSLSAVPNVYVKITINHKSLETKILQSYSPQWN